MTFYVTARTDDRAKLIVHEARITSKQAADMIASFWTEQGYDVVRWEES